MKVRHKVSGRVREVLEESTHFYLVPWDDSMPGDVYADAWGKNLCEIIQDEPTWRDVTGQCREANEERYGDKHDENDESKTVNYLWHNGFNVMHYGDVYRLRKVQLDKCIEPGIYAARWAFIVEKRDA